MFDSKETKYPLKTTGVLTLMDGFLVCTLSQMSLSGLEQLILILNSMKREADALSNDGKGGSRVVISGFYLTDWIGDAMDIYNSMLSLIDVVSDDKEIKKRKKNLTRSLWISALALVVKPSKSFRLVLFLVIVKIGIFVAIWQRPKKRLIGGEMILNGLRLV